MLIRKSLVAAGALVAALGMTACSSDDASDTAATTTASTTAASATTTAAGTDATVPTAEVLQEKLTVFFDPAATVEEKAAVIENGDQRAGLLGQFNGVLAGYPLTATVNEVSVDGDTVTATTQIAGPHGGAPVPVAFVDDAGAWVITDASTCEIFGMGRVSCD